MLNSNALTTVTRLSEFLEIDVPTSGTASYRRLESIINTVSSFVQKYTGRTFKKTTYTNEEYTPERGQSINLKHFPVVTSEPIIIERRNSSLNVGDWETIDGEFYSLDADAGIIQSMGDIYFFRGRDLYRVTYTAGYDFDNSTTFLSDTEAGDVELAVWLMAQDLKNMSGSSASTNIKQERIGDYSVTYGNGSDFKNSMFGNPQALAILDSYGGGGGLPETVGVLTPLQSL